MIDLTQTGYCFNCREVTTHNIRFSGIFKYCDCSKCGTSINILIIDEEFIKLKVEDKDDIERVC